MYPIATDLLASAKEAVAKVGLAKVVIVEESPDWPGELIFQPADAQGFYDRYGDWTSRYLVLNQLFALRDFVDLIVSDGYLPVFAASTRSILRRVEELSEPLKIEGFTCPDGRELFPFQVFSLNKALERATKRSAADRLFFCNWCTGSGKSLMGQAGAQELFNRGWIDLVVAFTEMGSKLNLATDAKASFANTTTLRVAVNDGTKRKRQAVYSQQANGYPSYPQVFVCNYEKAWADFDELKELVKGRRVLWIFDECSKVLKATGAMTKTRTHLMRLVKASKPIVWPMDASVVDSSPLRYRDVYNLTGVRQEDNPLGTRDYFKHRYGGFGTSWAYTPDEDMEWNRARLHEIRHKVADRTLAVRKTDPGVREYFKGMRPEIVTIHMSDQDRKLYDLIVADGFEEVARAKRDGDRAQIANHPGLLRYLCNTPETLTVTANELGADLAARYPELVTSKHCAKLEFFLNQVESIANQGDKVVAFTHFTKLGLLLLAPHIAARGINFVLYYGVGMKAKERQEAQHSFKTDPSVTLFLASDAGKRGLNLPEARYVINYECPYSYDTLMQRSERINRADSELEGMTSYIYVTKDSIEERVLEENERRRMIAQAVQGTVESLDYGRPLSEEENAHYLLFGTKETA